MEQEKLNYLISIYNNLLLINTKGESTLVMAECLRALQGFINEEQKIINSKEVK